VFGVAPVFDRPGDRVACRWSQFAGWKAGDTSRIKTRLPCPDWPSPGIVILASCGRGNQTIGARTFLSAFRRIRRGRRAAKRRNRPNLRLLGPKAS